MLQRNFKEKHLSITKRETNRCTPLMTTLRNRIMQLSLSFDRLINSWLSLVTTSRSLIKGERKKKRKRKLVTCVRRIEAIRLLKLRWTIDRERGGRRLSKFMADSRILRRITNAHFAEIRAFSRPTLKYFQSNWPAGWIEGGDPVGINNGEIHQRVTKIVMIILSHREGTSINRC